MNKRIAFLLIGLLISVVSLYLAFKDFDLGQVWDAIGHVRLEFFAIMIVPYVLTFMTKVWRWRVMFHPDEKRVSRSLLFGALMISYIPLPFRAGEVARGVVASSRSGIPAARVFSTIVVEKVLDILTLLLFLGISLPFVGLPQELRTPALLLGAVVLVATLVLLALVLKPNMARKLISMVATRLPSRLGPRIETMGEQVLQGLAPLSNLPIATKLGLWSLATWGVNVVTVYLILLAFNVVVTPMAAVVLVVVTNLSMAIPSSPGSVGPYEAAVILVLTILGVPSQTAKSFALIYHFVGLVPVALLGIIAAIQQGVGMATFQKAEDNSGAQEAGGAVIIPESAAIPPLRNPKSAQDKL